MKTALYVARIIQQAIVYDGAKSWQWWRAIGGDYKDGLIREYTTDDNFLDGRVEDSKLMWALAITAVLSVREQSGYPFQLSIKQTLSFPMATLTSKD